MALQFIITNAGRAAMLDPATSASRAVTIAAVGVSATAIVAGPTNTTLPGEVKRISTIAGDAVAADVLHLMVRDESADVFTVRSFALYLADGTLFGLYGQANVILEKSSGAVMLLAVDLTLVNVPAANITFGATNFLNPPATTDRPGVVELATNAEAEAGLDALRALTPANIASILSAAKILQRLITVDGAGSGLDADLLDGQHGAWYADIAGRLGYTPLSVAAYTAADVKAKLVTVDGAGSGVDADLLDGQDASYFTAITDRLGFTPVRQGGGTGQTTSVVRIGWDGNFRLKAAVDGSDLGNIVFDSNVSNVWRSSNDGAGSGLDADLLDGQDGGYYTNITARLGFTPLNATTYTAADVLAKLLTVDGAGSGVDADQLDGQDGAYYANIVARLGFTPLNATSYTAADVKAKLVTVDGAGSGLDADLLDGQDGGYYTNVTARLGFTPVRQGSGPGQYGSTIAIGWDGNFRLKAAVDGSDLGNIVFDSHVSDVWRASNDGAGSGLDADLLDGYDGGAYDRLTARTNDLNGSRVHADGLIECWGTTFCPASSTTYVSLPAHSSWCVPVGSSARASDSQASCGVREVVGSPPSGFNIRNNNNEGVTFFWHTKGK